MFKHLNFFTKDVGDSLTLQTVNKDGGRDSFSANTRLLVQVVVLIRTLVYETGKNNFANFLLVNYLFVAQLAVKTHRQKTLAIAL